MWPWLLLIVIAFALALVTAQRWRRQPEAGAAAPPAEGSPATSRPAAAASVEPSAAAEQTPAPEEVAVPPAPAIAPFSHRRHWAILEGVEDAHGFLLKIFEELLQKDSRAGAFVRNELCHIVDNRGHLMFSALLRRGEQLELLAMFPYSESPHIWPVVLERIEESPDGLEARLLGSCAGAAVGVYDTLYLKNRDAYRLGDTYDLQVSAVAYQLEPDQLGDDFAPDFAGFGPLTRFSPDQEAAPDEIVFHSYIESVTETTFWGVPLRVYVIPLARPNPEAEPLRVEVYAHDEVADRVFAVGERVRGVLWLFAMCPTSEAPAPAPAPAIDPPALQLNGTDAGRRAPQPS
jgi:hypothetical protein